MLDANFRYTPQITVHLGLPTLVMTQLDKFIKAGTRENTRLSYRSAINHFEDQWGGFLPATAESVGLYLAEHADKLTPNTLQNRLAGLSRWHSDQGFPDPTKSPLVRKVFKGIKALNLAQPKQAKPIQVQMLAAAVQCIDKELVAAKENNQKKLIFQLSRDKALFLIGFWKGLRSDELCQLEINNVTIAPDKGMSIFIPSSKTDKSNQGKIIKLPALSTLCPVNAYLEWIDASKLSEGPIFRRIDRWGNVSDVALQPSSLSEIIRKNLKNSNIAQSESYSSHSLRRGFATWANQNGWDIKLLMEYVGWKDVKSALRYIDTADQYAQHKIESGIKLIQLDE